MTETPPGNTTHELRLRLMGDFALTRGTGAALAIASRKNRALLAILAMSPGQRAPRERLASLLWGEHDDNAARNSLRQALAGLRKELEAGAPSTLDQIDDQIVLRPGSCAVDALAILEAAGGQDLDALRAAAALCRCEFLADAAVNEEAFENWLSGPRARLAAATTRLFEQLASMETGVARVEAAQRLVALDPLRESSHRQLMSALAATGERALALRQYEACARLLQDDLGVAPAAETQMLRQRIAAGDVPPPPDHASVRPSLAEGPETRLPSVAVLPFANLDDDPAQGYFSDGVTGDIISELARWRLITVQSRSASFRYRGSALGIRQIARELNVRYIVEGSVRRMGTRMRVSVQLIDAETGNHAWAERFDRDAADIFAVQDQVVRTIVSTLAGRVQVAAVEQVSRKPPAILQAYECVLKGNLLPWNEPAGAAEALQLFSRAVELDPAYGLAHSLLASMLALKWKGELAEPDATLQEAMRLAQRAVELDSNDSTCFSILAQIVVFRGAYDLAIGYARRAIEINPNNQWNMADLGNVLVYAGDAAAALDCFTMAREIDPFFNPSWLWPNLGLANMVLQRHAEALAFFEHLTVRDYWVAALMAGCCARLGNPQRAAALAAECLAARPDFSIGRRLAREPFKAPGDAAHLSESLRLAGLPA